MSKNSWLSICLMLIISSAAWANASEQDQAYYQNDRSTVFNDEEDNLNDQGYIEDMEQSEVKDIPGYNQKLKVKTSDCNKTDDCQDIDIEN